MADQNKAPSGGQNDEINGGGGFSFGRSKSIGRNGLPKIETQKETTSDEVCHDDSAAPVKAQTLDELHSLQKKKSAPTTPIRSSGGSPNLLTISEEDRHKQQLQSIRLPFFSLISIFFLLQKFRLKKLYFGESI